MNNVEIITHKNLLVIINELTRQPEVGVNYDENELSYDDEMRELKEYVEFAHEYSVAYEAIVATLEQHGFILSGSAAVRLLELGLIMRYKTDKEEDAQFDSR